MSTQTRIAKPQARDNKGRFTSTKHAEEPQERDAEATDLLDATDDLLAEIDAALDDALGELSAQEFVAGYIQKGGQ